MRLGVTLKLMAAVAGMALVFAFAACESQSLEEIVPQASLLSVKLLTTADKTITIVGIPAAIPGAEWDNAEYEPSGADFGTIPVKTAAETEDVRFTVTVSPNARVQWGTARLSNKPNNFNDTRQPATFDTEDFLYFKVTADDGVTSNYYRFYSILASPVKELAGIAIAGRDPNEITVIQAGVTTKFKVPTPSPSVAAAASNVGNQSFRGQIDITNLEATVGALVAGIPQDATATVKYAVAQGIAQAQQSGGGGFGEFFDTSVVVVKDEQNKDISQAHKSMTFSDANILLVEVTSANEEEVNYYTFQVTAGRMASIAALKFDGVEAKGKGVKHTVWANVAPGSFASADQTASGFRIGIELDDPAGTYDYVKVASISSPPSSGFATNDRELFNNKEYLVIRVRSARNNNADTSYYKVQVELLAANFTKHPKSAAYNVTNHSLPLSTVNFTYKGASLTEQRVLITADSSSILHDPIAPLTFELDRDPASGSNFSYQWYEINSWYGGYGFDRDGRIFGDDGYGEGLATADRNILGSGLDLDEKANVSLHNGGNQYYRLPSIGRAINGASGTFTTSTSTATYTPKIDASKRPFITGFTNSTHYYWVVVTDATGRQVTSERAAIVAEWGQEWNHGRPLPGTNVTKKHYIVDMYPDNKDAPGFKGPPRNPDPFKAGNHADKYLIPMTFPNGFNVMDYSVVTCQARFYLADGREWIQNWTQGDFGFANGNTNLVLWYNLTNDNATRGLAKSGNDPQGSGLTTIPSHLIVQPAGTKPIKEMPPFLDNGQPQNTNDAQGWFTPYIEIVELRFEGPAR